MSRQAEIDKIGNMFAMAVLAYQKKPKNTKVFYRFLARYFVDHKTCPIRSKDGFECDMEKVLSGNPTKWGHPIKPIDYKE